MPSQIGHPLGVVLLGAGAAARMGRPKLLLPWGETSVIGHLLAQWQSLGARQIAVVCAAPSPLTPELDRLTFPPAHRIVNPRPEEGMFSSIQCASQWRDWDAALARFVIVLGDQPHLRPDTLRVLLQWGEAHPNDICQPSRQGRPRHPVLLPAATFFRLRDARASDLKQFLATEPGPVRLCEVDDPGLELDLDTPADYEAALKLTRRPALA